jgi:ABC-type Mn2+/Zn2+ transport system permease subunit
MTTPALSDLVVPTAMAVAAGLIGSFAVMRRMALASDALSHVALPGVAIALLLRVDAFVGGLAALLLGALLVWALERKTRLPTEALIGVVFSAALAAGSMLASGDELIEALLGAPRTLTTSETVLGLGAAALVIAFAWRARSRLVITLVSPDLARTSGIDVPRVTLLFLLAFALTVALGLRYLGVLLMGSLIISPAATAKYLARGLRQMQLLAVAIAVAATLAGSLAAPALGLETGPLVITVAAAIFVVALLRPRPA